MTNLIQKLQSDVSNSFKSWFYDFRVLLVLLALLVPVETLDLL